MLRICIDLDNTLCTGKPYTKAIPIPGARDFLKKLKSLGVEIIIYTARGMGSNDGNLGKVGKNVSKLTLQQLDAWGFEYDEIYFGKPSADFYLDDKNLKLVNYEQVIDLLAQAKKVDEYYKQIETCSVEVVDG
jgi:capsule biosynthesis phosphatase